MKHVEQALQQIQRSAATKLAYGLLMISCAAAALVNALLAGQ